MYMRVPTLDNALVWEHWEPLWTEPLWENTNALHYNRMLAFWMVILGEWSLYIIQILELNFLRNQQHFIRQLTRWIGHVQYALLQIAKCQYLVYEQITFIWTGWLRYSLVLSGNILLHCHVLIFLNTVNH